MGETREGILRLPLERPMVNDYLPLVIALGTKKIIAAVGVGIIVIGAAVYFLVIKKKPSSPAS